jgi:hypothetical protein
MCAAAPWAIGSCYSCTDPHVISHLMICDGRSLIWTSLQVHINLWPTSCAVTVLGSGIVHGAGFPVPTDTYVYCDTAVQLTGVSVQLVYSQYYQRMGTAVAQRLRCCTTNRKVAGSIPDGVIGIFHWHNPSDRTMALGVDSAFNRNEYLENFLGVNAAGA